MDDRGKSEIDRQPNQPPKHQGTERDEDQHMNINYTSSREVNNSGGGLWSFGDLVKTLTTRSEKVLETYRHDLKEFGSGLRKESDLFREVASRAVKDLPSSIEAGASAIDGVLNLTADIISQGKNPLLEPSDVDGSDASDAVQNHIDRSSLNSRVYSRFDSQLNAIQSDARTYREDPEDLNDYNKWKLGFLLGDREMEIEKLIGDNVSVEAIYKKLVPDEVDDGSFWCRYFYRVQKLKQKEDRRANLVRRSLTTEDEEDLSWDIDEEEEGNLPEIQHEQSSNNESLTVSSNVAESVKKSDEDGVDESKLGSSNFVDEIEEKKTVIADVGRNNEAGAKQSGGHVSGENVESVPKLDQNLNASKNDDVVEEDLEWDEIGDLGDNDEKEVSLGNNPKKADVFKQLNTAEDDEDLNWDIEDDDEPVKVGNSK